MAVTLKAAVHWERPFCALAQLSPNLTLAAMGLRADSARPQRVSGSARTDSRRAEPARNPIASHVNFGDDSAWMRSRAVRTQWTAALTRGFGCQRAKMAIAVGTYLAKSSGPSILTRGWPASELNTLECGCWREGGGVERPPCDLPNQWPQRDGYRKQDESKERKDDRKKVWVELKIFKRWYIIKCGYGQVIC